MLKGMQRAIVTIRRSNPSYLLLLVSVSLLSVCTLIPTRAVAQPKTPRPLKQDESCLACHGQAGMTSSTGKSISIDPARHAASVHGTLGCNDCHATIKDFPHPDKVAKVQCSTCHTEEASHVTSSIPRRARGRGLPTLPRRSPRSFGCGTDGAGKMRAVPRR